MFDATGRISGVMTSPAKGLNNVAFAGSRRDHLYVTCSNGIYKEGKPKHGVFGLSNLQRKPPDLLTDPGRITLLSCLQGHAFHSDARHPFLSDHATSGRHALRSCRPVFQGSVSRWSRLHSKFRPHQLDHDALFFPFILWESNPSPWEVYPFHGSLPWLFCRSLAYFSAIKVGDISLVMPVLGTKSVFVALFAWLIFGIQIPGGMWLATLLTAASVYILGKTDRPSQKRRVPLATGLTILSAACFGLCDALVQQWASIFGLKAFLTLMFLGVGLLATFLVGRFESPLKSLKSHTLVWLGAGPF